MAGPSGECCGDCYYAEAQPKNPAKLGEDPGIMCKLDPPRTQILGGGGGGQILTGASRPTPAKDDWCGRFRSRANGTSI